MGCNYWNTMGNTGMVYRELEALRHKEKMDEQYNVRFNCRNRIGSMDGDLNVNEN